MDLRRQRRLTVLDEIRGSRGSVVQDGRMHRRTAITAAVAALVVASCSSGSSDQADATLPDITLLTTTTTSTVPVFEPADEPADTLDESTTTTPEATTTVPSTTVPPTTTIADDAATEAPFDLELTGVGAAAFGADPDGIIGFISSFIGGPTLDTGYVDPFEFGACAGTQARRVFWGSLMLEFGDASDVASGRLHFYAYQYGSLDPAGLAPGTPPDLATPEGITYGSTVRDLLQAYPATTFLEADEFLPTTFIVNDNLRGHLTGLTDLDTVTMITGGLPCEG